VYTIAIPTAANSPSDALNYVKHLRSPDSIGSLIRSEGLYVKSLDSATFYGNSSTVPKSLL
jgi:hypothetical protein